MKRVRRPLGALLLAVVATSCSSALRMQDGASSASPEQTGVGTTGSCVRIRGNRLYRRPDQTLGYWHAEREAQRLLSHAPYRAEPTSDGLYRAGDDLFVSVEIGDDATLSRIVADGSTYRIKLDDDAVGPTITRHADGTWQFADDENNRSKGSAFADVIPDTLTTDPRTTQRAAELAESMGLDESRIEGLSRLASSAMNESVNELAPLIMLSLDHAFIETLPARLRTQASTRWSGSEIHAIADDISGYIGKPLAFHGPGVATPEIVVTSAGRSSPEAPAPDDAIGLVVRDGRFALRTGSRSADEVEYASIFAALAVSQRSPHDHRARTPAEADYAFRKGLADFIDATSSRSRHVRAYNAARSIPDFHPLQVKRVSKVLLLRQALFDTLHRLSSSEEARILQAALDLVPQGHGTSIEVRHRHTREVLNRVGADTPASTSIVLFASLDNDARRVTYYQRPSTPGNGPVPSRRVIDDPFSPIIDALLNTDDGRLRKLIGLDEWDFRLFGERIMRRVATDENPLLEAPADRFAITEQRVLTDAQGQRRDRWSVDDRHFVRLRSLDGHTQVIETRAADTHGEFEVLRPDAQARGDRGTGYFVMQRDDLWYPVSQEPRTSVGEASGHRPLTRTYALPLQ